VTRVAAHGVINDCSRAMAQDRLRKQRVFRAGAALRHRSDPSLIQQIAYAYKSKISSGEENWQGAIYIDVNEGRATALEQGSRLRAAS